MHADVEGTEADAAEAEVIARPLTCAETSPDLAVWPGAIQGPATIHISTDAWFGATILLQLVMLEVRAHISKADDFGAKMAISCPGPIGQFMRCQAGDERLG